MCDLFHSIHAAWSAALRVIPLIRTIVQSESACERISRDCVRFFPLHSIPDDDIPG